ncbi:MAG: hypothetical protein IPF99_41770 [Deltaproteobacteria bacterium]|nr:hypothetical protein [Deltaproteobacteria bacterium]
MKTLLAEVDRIAPSRVVFDSLSDIRMLAQDALNYRRQVLTLKQYFSGRECTVIMLDDLTGQNFDGQLQSLAHGSHPGADGPRLWRRPPPAAGGQAAGLYLPRGLP